MLNAYFESKKSIAERNNQILELFLEVEDLSGNWNTSSNVELDSNGKVVLKFWTSPDYYDDEEPEERIINLPITLYEGGTNEEIINYFEHCCNKTKKTRLVKTTIDDLYIIGILYDTIGAENFAKCVEFIKTGRSHYYVDRETFVNSLLGDH